MGYWERPGEPWDYARSLQRLAAYRERLAGLTPQIVNRLHRERIDPDDLPTIEDRVLLGVGEIGPKRLDQIRRVFPRAGPEGAAIPNWVGEGAPGG